MNKARFTIIDAGIIVVILAVLVLGIRFIKPDIFSNSEMKTADFSVMVTNTDSGIGEIIKPGDEVSISFSEKAFATVTAVREEPYKKTEFNNYRGLYESSSIDGKSNLIIDLTSEVTVTDTQISSGNLAIRVGSEMPVRGKGYTVKGYVISVEDK